MSTILTMGRFASREQAEAARQGFEQAHRDLAPFIVAEDPRAAGTFTYFYAERPADDASWLEPGSKSPNSVLAADVCGPLKPRRYTVKHILPLDAQLAVVYGDSGSGKSFLVNDIMADVELGRPAINGTRKTMQRRVVRIVAEGAGDDEYRRHVLARAKGIELAQLPRWIDNAPNLTDAKQARSVVDEIQAAGGCDLLLIDTLSATFSGNENSSEHMGPYIRNVQAMRRLLNCQCIVIHHCGKSADRGARGWSGIRAAVDVEIEVTRTPDCRIATVTKMKGGTDGRKFAFTLDFVPLGRDEDGDEFGSCTVHYLDAVPVLRRKLGEAQERVLDALAEVGKPVTLAEFMKQFPEDKESDIKRILAVLAGPKHQRVICADGLYSVPKSIVQGSAEEFDK